MLQIPLPSGSIYDVGLGEYSALLISAVDMALNTPRVWTSADWPSAEGYVEDLIRWIMEILPTMTTLTFPIGMSSFTASTNIPSGWLEANGQAVSRTTYSALFAELGTTWGSGDGSTTFNVPDLRGRVVVGAGQGSALSNRTLAQAFGEETHYIQTNELPPHAHNVTMKPSGGSSPANITRNLIGSGSDQTVSTSSVGSGAAHNNMQPSLVMTPIIYAGV